MLPIKMTLPSCNILYPLFALPYFFAVIMVAFKASGAADAAIKFVADYCTVPADMCPADFTGVNIIRLHQNVCPLVSGIVIPKPDQLPRFSFCFTHQQFRLESAVERIFR